MKEFFYSTIDANYYNENEFISCLGMLGLDHLHSMTRYEWSVVKSVMGVEIGRPRRFSAAFLESERIKLKDYRRERRHNKAASSISIGDTVTVCDIKTKTIARGLVISTVEAMGRKKVRGDEKDSDYEFKDSYLVQLERPELGIEIYDDVDIAVIQAGIVVRQDIPQTVSPFNCMSFGSLNGTSSGQPRTQGQRNGKNSQNKAMFTQSTDNSSETADSTPDSSQCMEDTGDESYNTDWGETGSFQTNTQSSRQSSSFGARDSQTGEDLKEESKELILKRCADAVQKVWPDCLAEAERCIERELDIMIKGRAQIGRADGSGLRDANDGIKLMSDSRFKDLMVRCIGGLLLLRDTKGKWQPQYAEPVLVAVASGICEGGSVQDYRLMMSNLGVILSNI